MTLVCRRSGPTGSWPGAVQHSRGGHQELGLFRLEATGINCVSKKDGNSGHLNNKKPTSSQLSPDTGYSWEEKMFGFHKPKMYRSIEGCCICRAKSSSSRFTDSKRYEKDFQNCFGLHEARSGDICNACVLLVKRWKKLPAGSKKNWNHVVDARAGPSLKTTLKPKKMKTLSGSRIKSNQISKLQKEFKRHNSDAHSTTSSASPAQSPCYSNQSDEGSDTEMSAGSSRTPVFSFLDLTYWKRQKVCCGIIYKGRFGEVLIDTHLFKPCCSNKKSATEKPEQEGPQSPAISTQEEW
ncbi:protein FAM60A isoform X1 [Numida meleagris]|nr:protein FAM60A isoform X1 [Numida meleagris]